MRTPKMKFPGKGFQNLDYKTDRQTHVRALRNTQTQTDATDCITSRIRG